MAAAAGVPRLALPLVRKDGGPATCFPPSERMRLLERFALRTGDSPMQPPLASVTAPRAPLAAVPAEPLGFGSSTPRSLPSFGAVASGVAAVAAAPAAAASRAPGPDAEALRGAATLPPLDLSPLRVAEQRVLPLHRQRRDGAPSGVTLSQHVRIVDAAVSSWRGAVEPLFSARSAHASDAKQAAASPAAASDPIAEQRSQVSASALRAEAALQRTVALLRECEALETRERELSQRFRSESEARAEQLQGWRTELKVLGSDEDAIALAALPQEERMNALKTKLAEAKAAREALERSVEHARARALEERRTYEARFHAEEGRGAALDAEASEVQREVERFSVDDVQERTRVATELRHIIRQREQLQMQLEHVRARNEELTAELRALDAEYLQETSRARVTEAAAQLIADSTRKDCSLARTVFSSDLRKLEHAYGECEQHETFLRSGLTCTHCLQLLCEPLTLVPCGHTFCSGCVSRMGGAGASGIELWCAECKGLRRNADLSAAPFLNPWALQSFAAQPSFRAVPNPLLQQILLAFESYARGTH
jgi:hypothetical protein